MARGRSLVALVAAAIVATGASGGQSDNEIRLENERLRTQVRDLERELEAARARVGELERQVTELQRLLRNAGTRQPSGPSPHQPEPKVSIDESVPNASPRALIKAIKASYDEATVDLEVGTPGDRDRVAYLRAVDHWGNRINRELKAQIAWTVLVTQAPWHDERNPRLELIAIDPVTHVPLGKPFNTQVSRQVLRRLQQLDERGEMDILNLKGVLMPNVRTNPFRDTPGAFDKPRYIGTFAECDPSVVVHTLTKPDEPAREDRQRE